MNYNQFQLSNSDISKSEYELQPIPTMSEINESMIGSKKNSRIKNNSLVHNLKTIEEDTFVEEESENSISLSSKSKISEHNVNKQLESINETDSSNYYNKQSIRDNLTIKMEHCSNGNIDFSDVYSLNSKHFLSGRSVLTPYKSEEINMEIYPNENQNFMKFKHSENYNNVNKDCFENNNTNICKENQNNNISHLKITNNNNNISMCSTEISFSISSKYENIDELSDYKYSKTPKLRKKIKSILKDFDLENEFELKKLKTNKSTLKNKISISSLNLPLPKKSIKKTSSQEINDKKRKIQHERKRKSENDITLTSLKNNPKNLLNMIHEKNNNQDSNNIHEPPTCTQLIQNFLDKEKLTNNKELQEQKEELNKKIQNIRSMKEQNKMFLKNKFDS